MKIIFSALFCITTFANVFALSEEKRTDMQTEFHKFYEEAKKSSALPPYGAGIDDTVHVDANIAYCKIIKLGPVCLPSILEELKGKDSYGKYFLFMTACRILKLNYYSVIKQLPNSPENAANWLRKLLTVGYKETELKFNKLQKEWNQEKAKSKDKKLGQFDEFLYTPRLGVRIKESISRTPMGKVYQQIQDLGILVLPCLMKELEKNNYDFIPIIDELTNGEAPTRIGLPPVVAKNCLEWWGKNKEKWIVPTLRQEKPEVPQEK